MQQLLPRWLPTRLYLTIAFLTAIVCSPDLQAQTTSSMAPALTMDSSQNPSILGQPVTWNMRADVPGIWPQYQAIGDSITYGWFSSSGATSFVGLLGANYDFTPVNRGVPGYEACDLTKKEIFGYVAPGDDQNDLYTLMVGTNDAGDRGVGAFEPIFNLCHQAAIAWLGSSLHNRFTGGDFSSIPSGWALDTTFDLDKPLLGLQSSTQGATATWPITTAGGPIALWYRIFDNRSGVFSVSVDGGSPIQVNAFTTPSFVHYSAGIYDAVGVLFVNASVGAHLVTTTVTSATGMYAPVGILAVGTTPAAARTGGPKVYVGGVPYMQNDVLSAATAQYNADALANVKLLAGMGFGVQFVDVRSYIFGTPAEMIDQWHPNDLGHAELFQAFRDAIGPVHTGSITLSEGSATLSTQTLTGGLRSYTSTALGVGSHMLLATLHVDGGTYPDTTATLTQVVNLPPTVTVLSVSSTSAYAGQPFTFSAVVTGSAGSVPTGEVVFQDSGTTLATVQLDATGHAVYQTASLGQGIHSITASYTGSSTYSGSTSSGSSATVNPPVVTLSTQAVSVVAYQSFQVKAQVQEDGAAVPVTYPGILTVSGPSVLNSGTPSADGSVSLSASLPAGPARLVATFQGTVKSGGLSIPVTSVSQGVAVTIAPAVTTTQLTASSMQVVQGKGFTLTAVLSDAPSTKPPDGPVIFWDGSTVLGTAALSGGASTFAVPALSLGTHMFSASYAGNTNFSASASAPIAVAVVQQDFTVGFAPGSYSVQTEHHGDVPLTLTSIGILAGPVDLACSDLPLYLSCSFGSSPVQMSASQTLVIPVHLDTDSRLNYARLELPLQSSRSRSNSLAFVPVGALFFLGLVRSRRRGILLALLLAVPVLGGLAGCGSSLHPPHTAPGAYTILVTATSEATGQTHTASLLVNVTP